MGLNAGDTCLVQYLSTYQSQRIIYTLHYRVTTPGSSSTVEGDLQEMANNFANFVANPMSSALLTVHVFGFTFNQIVCSRVAPAKTITLFANNTVQGPVVGVEAPANVAVVITKKTTVPGRKGIGSLHLAGVDLEFVTDGILEAGGITAYTAVANAMLSALTISAVQMSIEPVIFNPLPAPGSSSRIFTTNVQDTTRVMRRRTVRVGI